jgi:riboflavin kinase/FMN adenylyltransferase
METRLKVLRNQEQASKENIRGAALTIGSFDGVHRGHIFLLNRLREMAPNSPQVVMTFDPHPAKILTQQSVPRIFPPEDQIEAFASLGVDYLYFLPFTSTVAEQSAEEFSRQSIFGLFKPAAILVGYDFAFGKNRSGDYALLQKLAPNYHCLVGQCEPFKVEGQTVSSTRIRELIRQGQVVEAGKLLGRPYYLQGQVVEGKKLGRTIGIPTANLKLDSEISPALGVNMTRARVNGKSYFALTNVGTNPTVTTDLSLKVECFLLDFDQDIYGQQIQVDFLEKIREELKFSSLDALKKEIASDVSWARRYISAQPKV